LEKCPSILDLLGKTTLRDACAIISYSRLVIACDSGPIHLAVALGAPSISITGGGHYGVFVPYPQEVQEMVSQVVVHHPMDCYNCRWRCIFSLDAGVAYPCIGNISVDQVFGSVAHMLGPPSQ
jgi:ADP-heptose:LPS heptosyltransferase